MDPLKRFQRFLNEEEMPYFTDFDKSIFQYIIDNIENLQEGDDVNDVVRKTLDQDTNFPNYGDALKFIESFNGEYGRGWYEAIEYVYSQADEFGDDQKRVVSSHLENGEWNLIADLILLGKAEEIILASEVLAQKIAAGDEELSAEDIQDLEDELELFIGG